VAKLTSPPVPRATVSEAQAVRRRVPVLSPGRARIAPEKLDQAARRIDRETTRRRPWRSSSSWRAERFLRSESRRMMRSGSSGSRLSSSGRDGLFPGKRRVSLPGAP
jgi:hypothetical protein